MEYENCKYYIVEDTTPWHGDVFDHPEYKYFCSKDGKMKEIVHHCCSCIYKDGKKHIRLTDDDFFFHMFQFLLRILVKRILPYWTGGLL